ncbi:Protein kinase-like domain [Pseudocohnilembus persalinus]|uniref:cGMP-dependent protein kinase n=1 Tax=Pseudocohnilembus persalinus TaxID=266149 RepID=A0A0V0QWB8_PSEPJ|nr:Protein kinase-like domain [Pseudocohnilembus persalinus]|eukprot:KRX06681.1 Protein kinase-like domain [Pseudocohnilembus persalinus]
MGTCCTKDQEFNKDFNEQNIEIRQQTVKKEKQQGQSGNQKTEQKKLEQEAKQKREKKQKQKKIQADGIKDDVEILENVKKIDRLKTEADQHFIFKALGSHFVFSQLSDSDKQELISFMFYCENVGDYIFREGDRASCYFIIEKGECQVIINNESRRILKAKDAFGELALLYGANRSATVKCLEPCVFWAIDRNTFKKVVANMVQKQFEENRDFVEKTKFFKIMSESQKDSIAHVTLSQVYQKDKQIVVQGDIATSYFIIKQGKVGVLQNGKKIAEMGPGAEFGEQALTQHSFRGATVIALEDNVVVLSIGRDKIQEVLGDKIKTIMFENQQRWGMNKNELLRKLTRIQMEKIISKTKIVSCEKGEIIFEQGSIPDRLIFALEGNIKKVRSGVVVAEPGKVYGEQFLLRPTETVDDHICLDDIQNGHYAYITFQQFYEIIGGQPGGNIDNVFKKNENSHEVKYMKKFDGKALKQYENWTLDEFVFIKKLGFGMFGSVYLVKHKKSKGYQALKTISKAQVVEQNLERHLLQEKQVLEQVDFPFIMQYCRSFKDEFNVYFLVEFISGMELFDVIRDIGLLKSYDSQFYVGSLLLCMEYLHTNSIIYRDIKPENIMVDDEGYLRLIDMGTAKILKRGKGGRTFTIIGTPHYMAPEILTGKGYSYSVDLWSIGICLYEFMIGYVPFAEEADDPYEIYEDIIKKNLSFPSWLKDKYAKKLMQQLLNKTPELRLGRSYAALKASQWFENFDWDRLMDRQLRPPYIPPAKKVISKSYMVKQERLSIKVIDEIKKEQGQKEKPAISKKDPNWDKTF